MNIFAGNHIMEVTGKIDSIMPIVIINEKFSKRELILGFADNTGYQQYVKVSFYNSNIELLDAFKALDDVTITYKLAGRKITGKNNDTMVYNTIEALSIKVAPSTNVKMIQQRRDDVIILTKGEEDIELPF